MTNSFIDIDYLTGISRTEISDHFPMFPITKVEINKRCKSNLVFKRKITDVNLKEFKDDLLSTDWNDVIIDTDANSAYDDFCFFNLILHYDTFSPL